jgi:hypothetical protein
LPAGELFAQGDFFEFADAGSRDCFHEYERVRQLPTGEGFSLKLAVLISGAGAVSELQMPAAAFALLRVWNPITQASSRQDAPSGVFQVH